MSAIDNFNTLFNKVMWPNALLMGLKHAAHGPHAARKVLFCGLRHPS